ncbi:stonustoxin subunit beta-like [Anguilla anguilla]|uniref:stonustoxin subunit beta-like n=1 Tax=Anguilla anguilla TaxID=7936 RepID=UPI0015B0A90A|nr:stonustoxin subunit beta-like [Anguilla anguilla]
MSSAAAASDYSPEGKRKRSLNMEPVSEAQQVGTQSMILNASVLNSNHPDLETEKNAVQLTLDPNTAHRKLSLSEGNRRVIWGNEQPYPDHPERFNTYHQLLCREGLSEHCYWEQEWSVEGEAEKRWGGAWMGAAYKAIIRKGGAISEGKLGYNDKSWSLHCSKAKHSAWHKENSTAVPAPPSPSHRVGVYLDWPAGTLSFYSVSSDTRTLLHTFHTTFTEPLYPGFRVDWDSSVSLCMLG